MKTKLFLAVVGSFLLSGCSVFGSHHPLTPTKIEYKVAIPEAEYFTCERVALPDPKTLTDSQVAQLINDLVKANKTCANNMNAIHQYLDAAQKILEERNKN